VSDQWLCSPIAAEQSVRQRTEEILFAGLAVYLMPRISAWVGQRSGGDSIGLQARQGSHLGRRLDLGRLVLILIRHKPFLEPILSAWSRNSLPLVAQRCNSHGRCGGCVEVMRRSNSQQQTRQQRCCCDCCHNLGSSAWSAIMLPHRHVDECCHSRSCRNCCVYSFTGGSPVACANGAAQRNRQVFSVGAGVCSIVLSGLPLTKNTVRTAHNG
jgi:hypothetical protein